MTYIILLLFGKYKYFLTNIIINAYIYALCVKIKTVLYFENVILRRHSLRNKKNVYFFYSFARSFARLFVPSTKGGANFGTRCKKSKQALSFDDVLLRRHSLQNKINLYFFYSFARSFARLFVPSRSNYN